MKDDGLSRTQIRRLKQREAQYNVEFKNELYSTEYIAGLLNMKLPRLMDFLLSHNYLIETDDGRIVPHRALTNGGHYCCVTKDGGIEWTGRGLEFIVTQMWCELK